MKGFRQSGIDSISPESETERRLRMLRRELDKYDYYGCSDTEELEREIEELEEER